MATEDDLAKAAAFFRLPARTLNATEYWNVAFSGQLSFLHREPGALYTGEYDHYTRGEPLPKDQPFDVSSAALAAYPYEEDPRFAFGPRSAACEALAAVLRSPSMRRDTFTNGRQVLLAAWMAGIKPPAVPYPELRERVAAAVADSTIDLTQLLEVLATEAPRADEGGGRPPRDFLPEDRVVLMKALGLLKTDPSVLPALVVVVECQTESTEAQTIALWALGRHNDKAAIPHLTRWLSTPELEYHEMHVQRALQFLCSGPALAPLAYEDASVHWLRIGGTLPRDELSWQEHDALSVFWEKRLRIASWGPERLAQTLRDDEVRPVRESARARPT